MTNKIKIAREKFESGYNCSQSVLFVCMDKNQISQDTALKIANGFGAGMGRMQEVCGAVTGAIMVLGLKYGRGENEDRNATEQTYQKTRDFIKSFEDIHDSIICRELLNGCDLRTEEGQTEFMEKGLLENTCVKCVETAVRILENEFL